MGDGADLLQAITEHDEDAATRAAGEAEGLDLHAAIAAALPGWDDRSRALAVEVVARADRPGAGALLLALTRDEHPQVAVAAAEALSQVKDAPLPLELGEALPRAEEAVVRRLLFRALGRASGPPALETVRRLVAAEPDAETRVEALVAALKLGGEPEREALLKQISEARPDEALRMHDRLVYLGDPRLAVALLPWLASEAKVTRIGSDARDKMARMCDVALWTAHRLGVSFEPSPQHLEVFGAEQIEGARRAIEALSR